MVVPLSNSLGSKEFMLWLEIKCFVENELDESFKQLASYIHIPVGVLLPFKSQCFVRHYSKGQVIYFSSDETTHIYLLIEGNIMRENFNLNGDVYRYLNREKVLFP